jgi:hypothetical protein
MSGLVVIIEQRVQGISSTTRATSARRDKTKVRKERGHDIHDTFIYGSWSSYLIIVFH